MVKQPNHLPRLALQKIPQSGSKSRSGLKIRRDRRVIISFYCLMVVSDWSPPTSVSLQDLGGIEDCIQEVLELIVMPLKHPEIYTHTGIQPPR
jgi:ribosome biogenesis ATPase